MMKMTLAMILKKRKVFNTNIHLIFGKNCEYNY